MPDQRIDRYLLHTRDQVVQQTERSREITRRSVEILKESVPDTFLGRKTHEPFPSEKQAPLPDRGEG